MKDYFRKRKDAFGFAFQGIRTLFVGEAHAKIHLMAMIAVIVCGFIFKIERWEWCAVILCIGGVFMAEAFNTSIEKLCDRVSPEKHPLIKASKDVAAAAVLLFVFASIAVGLIIFIPKLVN